MTQTDFTKLVLPFKDKVFRLAKRLLVSREEACGRIKKRLANIKM